MGFHQIVPLEPQGTPVILVDRGWVPQRRETALDDPAGVVTVTGYVRRGDVQHWFSAADDEAARQFYTLDPKAIGTTLAIPDVESFVLVALGPSTAKTYPAPEQHLPRPPNNHLSYAITWYGLAVALSVIFSVWTLKAVRS
jgi:surfeit locus 1 family protein